MRRTEIRELTFRLVYSLESNEIQELKAIEYVKDCILGIKENETEINKEIENNITAEWKIERISKINLSLLKLAIYEIKYKQIPFKVEINEVVELAKKYGDDQASRFINGMLAKVVKDM